ncbi:MAG TPA: SRPBCC family protein [Streptosporangiaceae bacterium]|jgi:uncharacterized protein YndB with AHSA1/START domain|nr:SRPBCC family protein [Streptosporangiaceae bacterium]
MDTFENMLTIARPREEVFAFLADFRNVPRWNYAIDKTWQTSPGPTGVGATYLQTRSIPLKSQEAFEVTAFEPPRQLAVHGQIGPFLATITYRLESAAGGTRLTNRIDLEPSRAVMRLAAPLAVPRVKTAVAANLATLKQIMEDGR